MKASSFLFVGVLLLLTFSVIGPECASAPPSFHTSDFWDVDQVKALIRAGADINEKDKYGFTPLMKAVDFSTTQTGTQAKNAYLQNLSVVKYLISQKSKLDETNSYGDTALIIACAKNRNAEVIKSLVSAGADVNIANDSGITPLIAACMSDNGYDVVQFLIKSKASVQTKSAEIKRYTSQYKPEMTVLMHAAASSSDIRIIDEIISAGGNINETTYDGFDNYNALKMAIIWNPNYLVIEYIGKKTKDVQLIDNGELLIWTLGHKYGGRNIAKICSLLINLGVDVNKKLVRRGQFFRLLEYESDGLTALLTMVENIGSFELLEVLTSAGANVNDGSLHKACSDSIVPAYDHLQFIKYLVEKKANINAKDRFGDTPLHILCEGSSKWCYEAINFLLDKGADPKIKNSNGSTAFDVLNSFIKYRPNCPKQIYDRLKRLCGF